MIANTTYVGWLVLTLCFPWSLTASNNSTDFAILCIPLPLLWKVQLPLVRKLAIGVLLCSGIFIIVAAILRCVLSLKSIDGINVSTIWAIRETVSKALFCSFLLHALTHPQFVGIIAVNAACIRPLFSKTRWLSSARGQSSAYRKYEGRGSGHALATIGGSRVGGDGPTMASRRRNKTFVDLEDNSSEEHIVKAEYGGLANESTLSSSRGSGGNQYQDGIMVTTTFEVNPNNNKSTLNV